MKRRHARTIGAKKALYRKLVAEHRDWKMDAFELAARILTSVGLIKAASSAIAKTILRNFND